MNKGNGKKIDRRVLRTKRLLLDSLTQLMLEKSIKEISVKELADSADINRGTFYLHYKDVFDMVEQIEKDLLNQFTYILDKNIQAGIPNNGPLVLTELFEYLKKNKDILHALISPNGDSALLGKFRAIVKDDLQKLWNMEGFSHDYFDYYNSFIVAGYIGLVERWIQDDCSISVEEISTMSSKIISSGILALSKSAL